MRPRPKPVIASRREPEARRQAILQAGLDVFASVGFAAAKLDDVALKAGVAKGTIYLYFKDKQDLFEQIIREALAPVVAALQQTGKTRHASADQMFCVLFDLFRREVLETRRKDVLRLVITEGARFPAIAEFYYREVVTPGLKVLGRLARAAAADGELSNPAVARFPQLIIAPMIMAVVWDGLFASLKSLDIEGLLAAHRQLLLARGDGCGTAKKRNPPAR